MLRVQKGKDLVEIPREVQTKGETAINAYVEDGGKAYAEKKAAEAKALASKETKAAQKGGSK